MRKTRWLIAVVAVFLFLGISVSSAQDSDPVLGAWTEDITFEEAVAVGKEREIIRKFTEEVDSLEEETLQLRAIMEKHANLLEENLSDYPVENQVYMQFSQEKINKLVEISKQQQEVIARKEENLRNLKQEVDTIMPQSLQMKQENDSLRDENEDLRKELGGLYMQFGVMQTKRHEYKKAIDSYEKAILYQPTFTKIYYHLGLLYEYEISDSERAIAYFTQYLNLEPNAQNRHRVEELIRMLKG